MADPTDITIVPRAPHWPVRLDPVAPPSLRKVVRDTTPPTTTTETMEQHPITDDARAAEDITAKPPTNWRDRIKVHPAADAFPMMADEELKALGEDISANGLKMPIVFYNDGPGGGSISLLDGRNRLTAMELAGYHLDLSYSAIRDPGRTLRAEGPDGKQLLVHIQHENKNPRGFTISANLRRRHLSAEDRQKWAVELRAEGQSTRQIAEQLGVDQSTVVRDLAKASDATASVDRVTGKDGKSRPARMTRKPKAAPAGPKKSGPKENPVSAEPEAPKPANEPSGSPPVDVLLNTFHKLAPKDQVSAMQLFWDVLADWQKQQLREHVTAELPIDTLLTDRWPSMSGGEKAGVHSFLAAEMAKFETVDRPAAPAISTRL